MVAHPASLLRLYESDDIKCLGDPMLLSPAEDRTQKLRSKNRDQRDIRYDDVLQCWTAPFFMAPVNTRVVRRSEALMAEYGTPYGAGDGRDFTYNEAMSTGSKRSHAYLAQWALGALSKAGSWSLGRRLLKRFGPSPGEGPSEGAIQNGYTRCDLWGRSESSTCYKARIEYPGDAGNAFTIRCLCESALELTKPRTDLVGGEFRGGVLTPATAIGLPLIQRLKDSGTHLRAAKLTSWPELLLTLPGSTVPHPRQSR